MSFVEGNTVKVLQEGRYHGVTGIIVGEPFQEQGVGIIYTVAYKDKNHGARGQFLGEELDLVDQELTDYTFRDLYNYLQRMKHGTHVLNRFQAVQVYSNLEQINVLEPDRNYPSVWTSIGNIVFLMDSRQKVSLYDVRNGICDYENPHHLSLDDSLNLPFPIRNGHLVKRTILKMLEEGID